jgi:hypothetical protein
MRAEWDTAPEAFGISRICEVCGKKFLPATYHQFVGYYGDRRKLYFCSYTCSCRWDKPIRSYGGKEIQVFDINGNLLREFRNARQASEWLIEMGYTSACNRMIRKCCVGEVETYHKFIFKYKEIEK